MAGREKTAAEVFVPLVRPPGEAQVDFGHAEVAVAGQRVPAAFFVMPLPHSAAFFARAFSEECTESFPDGPVRAVAGLMRCELIGRRGSVNLGTSQRSE